MRSETKELRREAANRAAEVIDKDATVAAQAEAIRLLRDCLRESMLQIEATKDGKVTELYRRCVQVMGATAQHKEPSDA